VKIPAEGETKGDPKTTACRSESGESTDKQTSPIDIKRGRGEKKMLFYIKEVPNGIINLFTFGAPSGKGGSRTRTPPPFKKSETSASRKLNTKGKKERERQVAELNGLPSIGSGKARDKKKTWQMRRDGSFGESHLGRKHVGDDFTGREGERGRRKAPHC